MKTLTEYRVSTFDVDGKIISARSFTGKEAAGDAAKFFGDRKSRLRCGEYMTRESIASKFSAPITLDRARVATIH